MSIKYDPTCDHMQEADAALAAGCYLLAAAHVRAAMVGICGHGRRARMQALVDDYAKRAGDECTCDPHQLRHVGCDCAAGWLP